MFKGERTPFATDGLQRYEAKHGVHFSTQLGGALEALALPLLHTAKGHVRLGMRGTAPLSWGGSRVGLTAEIFFF